MEVSSPERGSGQDLELMDRLSTGDLPIYLPLLSGLSPPQLCLSSFSLLFISSAL